MVDHEKASFMTLCVQMAEENVHTGRGGPFAAIITQDNQVIGKGVNSVTCQSDPTAHAEVMAIRDACQRVGNYRLDGAVLYSSCEPCPMCLGAIFWAGISKVYYAADKQEAEEAGFRDAMIYHEINRNPEQRSTPFIRMLVPEHTAPFKAWKNAENKTLY